MFIKKIFYFILPFVLFSSCGSDDSETNSESSSKKITSFIVAGQEGIIDESNNTISLELPLNSDIINLTPTITISQNASIVPASGVTQDFTNPINYTVTAQDNTESIYVVTVAIVQCVNANDIISFTFDNKTYDIILEKKTWSQAAACAAERGGYLAEINSSAENSAIFNQISNNSSIEINNTSSSDGGGASYVWLGGNDIAQEGQWIWNGNGNGSGEQFWQGDANGSSVNGRYSNWGNEPDNFNNNQDALGLALTEWPLGSGSLGTERQWNDISTNNVLYSVIDYD